MKEPTATQAVKESTGLRITTTASLLDQIRQAYNAIAQRAFEVFENRAQLFGPELEDWLRAEDWFRAEAELLHPVHVRIVEAEGSLTVEAEVPGFTAEDLEVNVESRRLTISGKRQIEEKHKDKKTVYTERCANQVLASSTCLPRSTPRKPRQHSRTGSYN